MKILLQFRRAILICFPHISRPRDGRPNESIVVQLTLLRRLQKRLIWRLIVLCEGAVQLHLCEAQSVDQRVDMLGEGGDLQPMGFP